MTSIVHWKKKPKHFCPQSHRGREVYINKTEQTKYCGRVKERNITPAFLREREHITEKKSRLKGHFGSEVFPNFPESISKIFNGYEANGQ